MMLLMPGFSTAAAKFCHGRGKLLLRPQQNLVTALAKSRYGRSKILLKQLKICRRGKLFNEDWVKSVS
ncbi:hypothetical protein D0T60_06260 [Bacteroides sp. 224]|nr:hypothetical protein [Bacteroides sp. 224]